MNMQALMQQAQKMQREMEKAQKDLEAKEECKQVAACLRVFQKHGIKVSDAFEIMFELSAILKEEKGGQ